MERFDTTRLTIREMGRADAGFVLAMLNDPGFHANIGDRGVRTIEEAERYVDERMTASYAEHGLGMYRVARREDDVPVGAAGFVRRPGLDHPDLGFAFLADHLRRGYAFEAASALIARRPDLRPLLAVTSPGNAASAALLGRLGFTETGRLRLPDHDEESRLFAYAGA